MLLYHFLEIEASKLRNDYIFVELSEMLMKFNEVISNELSKIFPLVRSISHQIDFILG